MVLLSIGYGFVQLGLTDSYFLQLILDLCRLHIFASFMDNRII